MSKCWYCNEEITTGNNPEHLGICDKCYNEMFKCGNEFIRNMVTKIADLEAKLAESEKKFIVANNLRKNSDEVLLNYKTEKYGLDKTIQELRKMKLSLPEKEWYYKGFENCERQMSSHIADLTLENNELKQQLEETEEERDGNYENYSICWKDNEYLKQQLAEKEKEIETLKKCGDTDHFYGLLEDKKREIDICRKHIEKQDQDKILFAVEQLEQLKHDIWTDQQDNGWLDEQVDIYFLTETIDNQIKQLKEK